MRVAIVDTLIETRFLTLPDDTPMEGVEQAVKDYTEAGHPANDLRVVDTDWEIIQ